jgi:chromosomal replication initiation ATPase DnaA
MALQLGLDLPSVPALARSDFMIAPSNAMAMAMIEGWQSWPSGKLALCGPIGAGKTHLTHIWSGLANATIIRATDLPNENIPNLAQGHVAVEDVPHIQHDPRAQTALFHLHNLTLAEGHSLLLTGAAAVPYWGLGLPDLVSRMNGTNSVQLDAPDDTLLAAVLAKLFADRQLTPPADVIPYLLLRIERSFAAARDVVALLDALSLARKRPITRALAAQVLDNSQQGTQ